MEENKNEEVEVKKNKKSKKYEEQIKLLEQKINLLEEQKSNLENETLRSKAELINYRKRKDDEVSLMLKYCNEDLLKELLPVMDNFERAINLDNNNLNDEVSKFLSGFKLIYSHMKQILEKFGVSEVDCLGKVFDANFETSVFMDNDPNYDDEVVLDVLQKGYTYNDKLLRSASVKINKLDNVKQEAKENNENKEGNDKNE